MHLKINTIVTVQLKRQALFAVPHSLENGKIIFYKQIVDRN